MFFANPDVECPQKPIRFLGITWGYGWHEIDDKDSQAIRLAPWGDKSWHKWEVWMTCKNCGATMHRFVVTEAEIARVGLMHKIKNRESA